MKITKRPLASNMDLLRSLPAFVIFTWVLYYFFGIWWSVAFVIIAIVGVISARVEQNKKIAREVKK